MAKMEKSALPGGHNLEDFACFGPAATTDGEFENACLADLGCFNQEGVDSNKYVHASVAQSKKNSKWFLYTEWGRTGAKNPQFQFEEFNSKDEAQKALASYAHSKNDKRGIFKTIAGIKTLVAKPGKDVYKIQKLQSRTAGLPDAKNITSNAGLKTEKLTAQAKPGISRARQVDPITARLLSDLAVGTVSYARSTLEGGNIPTQAAIDEGREILLAAQKRLAIVGDDAIAQIKDKQIKLLTYELYSRIPKKKALRIADAEWILNKDNILAWGLDFDAFESAIYSDTSVAEQESNPYGDLPVTMNWLDPKSDLGKFIYDWMPTATANRHSIGGLEIKNVWKVERQGDEEIFAQGQNNCIANALERPPFQPARRTDLSTNVLKKHLSTNTALLCHGTRSVNVSGILRTMLKNPKELKGVKLSGAAFGVATGYFADDFKKSAGYTSMPGSYYTSGNGGIPGRGAFMFLMDVALGNPWVAPYADSYNGPPKGFHSIFGKANHQYNTGPAKCTSVLQNNEWIIFDRKQILVKYLVEFLIK